MPRFLFALLIASLLAGWNGNAFGQGEAVPAEPEARCGNQPIAIARLQWPSAALLAEIHSRLLTAHLGCTMRVLPGDLAATASSMGSTGQPAVAPEMWIARVSDIWNPAVKARKVRVAAQSYDNSTFEGWFIPEYVAAAHPELTAAAQLKDSWQIFAAGAPKAKFISCPIDWGCSVINRNMLVALGIDRFFDVIEPANRFELDTLIAAAVSRQEPVLFYYWQPNAVLSQFAFRPLDLGPYDKDALLCLARRVCPTPKPTSFAPESVVIALSEWVFTETPELAGYFQRAAMPIAEMSALLLALSAPGATIETVADKFDAERESVWRPWVGGEVSAPAQ